MATRKGKKASSAAATEVPWWEEEAQNLSAKDIRPTGIPIPVFVTEANSLAKFVEKYWEPNPKRRLPGLNQVEGRVPRAIVGEMRDLAGAVQEVNTEILFVEDPDIEARRKVERAQALVNQLEATIEFVLDDGTQEPMDTTFAEAKTRRGDAQGIPALAQGLSDYGKIAQELGNRMNEAGDFNPAWIKEARSLAGELIQTGGLRPGRPPSGRVEWRDKLATLLLNRMQRVRSAAAYVFREHPEIVRQAGSGYLRRLRAEARRRAREKGSAAGGGPGQS